MTRDKREDSFHSLKSYIADKAKATGGVIHNVSERNQGAHAPLV
jgi:hypothetical protein